MVVSPRFGPSQTRPTIRQKCQPISGAYSDYGNPGKPYPAPQIFLTHSLSQLLFITISLPLQNIDKTLYSLTDACLCIWCPCILPIFHAENTRDLGTGSYCKVKKRTFELF